jgi:tetratricopeptide (TPR) repeat protein
MLPAIQDHKLLIKALTVFSLSALFISCTVHKQQSIVTPDISNARRVEMNNDALKQLLDYGDFREPNITRLENLLTSHDFQAIEIWYESMLQHYKKDAQYEWFFLQGYQTFNARFAIGLKDLDLWVQKTGSYISYAARGIYKAQLGTASKIQNKQQLLDEAANDLQIAINKNPSLMPAYTWLIILANNGQMTFSPKQILEKAEEDDSRTFYVRYNYILSLLPQRGGDYQKMREFAEKMSKYIDSNPRLWSLQGEVEAAQGKQYYTDGNYDQAMSSYTAALKYGDRIDWLKRRATCYLKLGQFELAEADVNKALYYSPYDWETNLPTGLDSPLNFKYNLGDSNFIEQKDKKLNIRTYAVIGVDVQVNWLTERSAYQSITWANHNIAKIERILTNLGYVCLDRQKITDYSVNQKLSFSDLTAEKIQQIGHLINADAVIVATIPSMGRDRSSGQDAFFEKIEIKAILVADGQIIWSALLSGRVKIDPEVEAHSHMFILDSIESK